MTFSTMVENPCPYKLQEFKRRKIKDAAEILSVVLKSISAVGKL